MDEEDQNAAANAVNYTLPAHSQNYNPGKLADTEVVVQPGTGDIKAMAEDRPYSSNGGSGSNINYAVDTQYGGSAGVQTGSSSKLFTLITALEQGVPFGFTMHRTWQCHHHRLHQLPGRPGCTESGGTR